MSNCPNTTEWSDYTDPINGDRSRKLCNKCGNVVLLTKDRTLRAHKPIRKG